MNDEGLLLPNLVPVENRLILSPEAERERALALIEAEEAERRAEDPAYADEELPLSARCKQSICADCGHQKLVFLPARLCEKCLQKAAEANGLPFPKPGNSMRMNRAQRRAARRKR